MMDKNNNSIKILKEAVEISPNNIPLRIYYIEKLYKEGLLEELVAECKKLLQLAPCDKDSLLKVGEFYYKLGASDALYYFDAIDCFKALIEKCPLTKKEKAQAHLYLGYCLMEIDKEDEALKEFEIANKLDPKIEKNDKNLKKDIIKEDADMDTEDEEEDDTYKEKISLRAGDAETTITTIPFERTKFTFEDVGGLSELKEELKLKIIYPFYQQDIYKIYGKKVGGGILLYGPPGCGKTLMAKAVAGECKANFISVGISDILDMWHGNTEKNIQSIFETARKNAPCIIFFDEMEAIGGNRRDMHQHFHRIMTDELLSQMDGIASKNENILIIGATNAPWNIDTALKRPGRFDRIIFVPPPDEKAREEILKICLKDKPKDKINYAKIVYRTKHYSGADLKNLVEIACEKVLARAMQEKRVIKITTEDILSALSFVKPTTIEWFEIGENYATYANESHFYDGVKNYLQKTKGLKIL